eukprot:Gregarina_sp_Poly_1__7761@NODE_4391_length_612_cov_55_132110_g2924_i0_p1_GENE_NODE_4391_length_612_cov_55_132110_g2924_i0NODE_4391_length_612_cov_55_132110_g2924_i0_p1_ORF_typecomplete_len109_score6_11_NODE_4391_length_612_cov_55_132110_g2924_i081407
MVGATTGYLPQYSANHKQTSNALSLQHHCLRRLGMASLQADPATDDIGHYRPKFECMCECLCQLEIDALRQGGLELLGFPKQNFEHAHRRCLEPLDWIQLQNLLYTTN